MLRNMLAWLENKKRADALKTRENGQSLWIWRLVMGVEDHEVALQRLKDVFLLKGKHASLEEGMCALEAAAWISGLPHSDTPENVCPIVAAYVRELNDVLREDARQSLKGFIPRLIGSVLNEVDLVDRRMYICVDVAVRSFAVMALEKAGLSKHAETVAALPEILTREDSITAEAVLDKVYRHGGDLEAVCEAAEVAFFGGSYDKYKDGRTSLVEACVRTAAAADVELMVVLGVIPRLLEVR